MNVRLTVALIILAIAACALLSSYQHRPFELRVDANPGAWPTNAAFDGEARRNAGPHMLFVPCPLSNQNLPPRESKT